ncbi:MAG: arylsulfatase [Acidobacteriia bacterium]|nr:arylsulfatase [Terriglobia bacterium]
MRRREFLSGMAGVAGLGAQSNPRPNIVLIMADDMGFSDIGCYGGEIQTPNLDRLAKGGVRFTHFYNTARCCPTRSALLTGLYNHQAGVGHMVADRGAPAYQGYLNDRCVTIAEALRPAGYRTLMTGKWHVGEKRPHWPCDRGFEHYYGLISGGSNYFRLDKGRQMAIDNEPHIPSGDRFYMTDAFSDHAVSFVDQYAGKNAATADPFFLYLAYTAPHWPLHAWPEDIARYRGKYKMGWDELRKRRHARQIEMGIVDKRWPLTPRDGKVPAWSEADNPDEWDLRMAVYAAQIHRMDVGIGRLLAKLEEKKQLDNTLIMFLADNGGCAEENVAPEVPGPPGPAESFTSYRTPWANASNTPFRLYKHWVHEGGISTPFIAHWPDRIRKGGGLTHQPGHLIDVMATCLDVSGAAYPSERKGKKITPFEGRALTPIFEGRTRKAHPALYWEHEGNRAVREGDWKLVSRHPGDWELYDLKSDRTELSNLASKNPDRVARMKKMYEAWAARCGVVEWNDLQRARKA